MNKWFELKGKDVIYASIHYCYFCDSNEGIDKHHIIRKCDGGDNSNDNLIPLCKVHHKLIHYRNFVMEFSKGYFYLINLGDHLDKRFPNRRQRKREFPKSSLKNAIKNKKLFIGK